MMRQSPVSSATISADNRRLVLSTLRQRERTRGEIVQETDLSPAAVARITTSLEAAGLVRRTRQASLGGRPAWYYTFDGAKRFVAGVRTSAQGSQGILVDLQGRVVDRLHVPVTEGTPLARLEALQAAAARLLESSRRRGCEAVALGVAVPGSMVTSDGVVNNIPEMGWRDLPVRQLLSALTSQPIIVENDANALVWAEAGDVPNGNAAAILLDNGIGAGLIADGRLLRGQHLESGEIGYLLMSPESLGHVFPDIGDLERRVGSVGLAQRLPTLAAGDPPRLRFWDLLDAMSQESQAQEVVDQTWDLLAQATASIVAVFDPAEVIFGEVPVRSEQMLIEAIRSRLAGRVLRVPVLRTAQLGKDAVVVGVARLALEQVDLQALS